MQGRVIEIKMEAAGKDRVMISTDLGIKRMYGLPTYNVKENCLVEYEMVMGKFGPYAKFVRFLKEEEAEEKAGEDIHTETDTSMKPIGWKGYSEKNPMTVSVLSDLIYGEISQNMNFRGIWVKGEVTNYSASTWATFFDIKDERTRISCLIKVSSGMKPDFKLENGKQIALRGDYEFYQANGTYRIIVDKLVDIGEGDAKLKYEQLKEKLRNEGLFDPSHKKEIPTHAKRVGIVTSKDGQAIKDICRVARDRNPYVQLILYHVNVQGVNAVKTTIEGIKALDSAGVDVIIVGRGGGSDEELLVYNDEALARTVFNAKTPIVSAVGHEGHNPLIDEVVDLRCATPTHAAELVIFDVNSVINRVKELDKSIFEKTYNVYHQKYMRLEKLKAELQKNSPQAKLQERCNRLENSRQRLNKLMEQVFEAKKHRCEVLITRLNGLSPTAKLVRGFGYVSVNEKPVTNVSDVSVGDRLSVTIHDGEIVSEVLEINKKTVE